MPGVVMNQVAKSRCLKTKSSRYQLLPVCLVDVDARPLIVHHRVLISKTVATVKGNARQATTVSAYVDSNDDLITRHMCSEFSTVHSQAAACRSLSSLRSLIQSAFRHSNALQMSLTDYSALKLSRQYPRSSMTAVICVAIHLYPDGIHPMCRTFCAGQKIQNQCLCGPSSAKKLQNGPESKPHRKRTTLISFPHFFATR